VTIPKPSNMPGSDVFTNGYQRSPRIQGNVTSNVTFETTTQIFASYGTWRMSKDGKVRVSTSDYKQAKMGPGGSYHD
jgi:hypothetical protein